MNTAITSLLRTGVLLSLTIITVGMVITFVSHPDYRSSRHALGSLTSPATHFPNSIREVLAGLGRGSGEALITAGLLVLIATPVARVALSVVIFIIARDWLYATITIAVFIILMISFAVGRAAA